MPPSITHDYSKLYIPAAIVIAGIIIGVFAMIGLSNSSGAGAQNGGPQIAVDISDVKTEGDPYIGKADAKIVLAYWSDFQCPFCKQFELNTLPLIVRDYVDTGKVKVVFKDYAFLSEDSTTAAVWGRAVWESAPTKYWDWREAMYEAQDEEHGGFGDEASIYALTKTISGIDADAIRARVAANRQQYLAKIDADKAEGTGFGVNGTPGFITGKTMIAGAEAYASFKAALDDQL